MSFTITINTLEALDAFLFTSSYVEGFQPTQADVKLLDFVGSAPDAARYPNVARWYKHITSFSAQEQAKFPAEAATVSVQGTIGTGASGSGVSAAPAPAAAAAVEDEDDFDPFAETTEDEKAASEAAKASAKPKVVGKSSIVLDVKPWGEDTDLDELERLVRAIDINGGITWGASKKEEIAYGLKKLQIMLTIVDDLVSGDDLEDAIVGIEDLVQSMDIVAWNKV